MSHKRRMLATMDNPLMEQSENANIEYTVSWATRLGSKIINLSEWVDQYSNSVLTNPSNTVNETKITVKGDTGRSRLTNKVTLDTGEVFEFHFILNVIDNSYGFHNYDYHPLYRH